MSGREEGEVRPSHDSKARMGGEAQTEADGLWFSNQGPLGHDGETNDTGELKANLEATRREQSDWSETRK
ncbi:hypothetical protein PCASD_04154 [Puccinia coronata f. sp. avenae]|uniref:Uncharacterized protein n=1 Tax=Puccinia coronata f. sp. avenae TaxID=200324 RepID=A0A2N5V828_9BASI|nr:hypothetical protein PCASD_04154 [Puccinia coronata f. sp. avenae]